MKGVQHRATEGEGGKVKKGEIIPVSFLCYRLLVHGSGPILGRLVRGYMVKRRGGHGNWVRDWSCDLKRLDLKASHREFNMSGLATERGLKDMQRAWNVLWGRSKKGGLSSHGLFQWWSKKSHCCIASWVKPLQCLIVVNTPSHMRASWRELGGWLWLS